MNITKRFKSSGINKKSYQIVCFVLIASIFPGCKTLVDSLESWGQSVNLYYKIINIEDEKERIEYINSLSLEELRLAQSYINGNRRELKVAVNHKSNQMIYNRLKYYNVRSPKSETKSQELTAVPKPRIDEDPKDRTAKLLYYSLDKINKIDSLFTRIDFLTEGEILLLFDFIRGKPVNKSDYALKEYVKLKKEAIDVVFSELKNAHPIGFDVYLSIEGNENKSELVGNLKVLEPESRLQLAEFTRQLPIWPDTKRIILEAVDEAELAYQNELRLQDIAEHEREAAAKREAEAAALQAKEAQAERERATEEKRRQEQIKMEAETTLQQAFEVKIDLPESIAGFFEPEPFRDLMIDRLWEKEELWDQRYWLNATIQDDTIFIGLEMYEFDPDDYEYSYFGIGYFEGIPGPALFLFGVNYLYFSNIHRWVNQAYRECSEHDRDLYYSLMQLNIQYYVRIYKAEDEYITIYATTDSRRIRVVLQQPLSVKYKYFSLQDVPTHSSAAGLRNWQYLMYPPKDKITGQLNPSHLVLKFFDKDVD